MAAATSRRPSHELVRENEELRAKLAEAQEVLRAIQSGDVDAVVVSGPRGEQIFTLKGAESAYRVMVEAMNESAAALAADGTVLYCNQRLSDLLETPLEQIIGGPVIELVAADSRSTFEGLFASALAIRPGKTEVQLQGRSRRQVPVQVSLREMDADGFPGVCMVVTDLTERKRQDELIAAGELARSILESAAEAIAVCDETSHIIAANAGMKRLCGVNPLFQHFDTVLPLKVGRGVAGELAHFSIAAALSGETPRAREVTVDRGNGEKLWLLLTVGRLATRSGVAGCVVTLTDITERRQAEEALLHSRERLRVTLASIGDAVMVADSDSRITFLNPVAAELTGWQPEEAQGQPIQSVLRTIDEQTREPAEDLAARVLREQRVVAMDHTALLAKDGREIPIEDSAAPIFDSKGKIAGVVLVFHDVTEKRRAQQALLRSEKLASVGRMAATIAHEINNPLAAVTNSLFLARSATQWESARQYLDIADAELRRVSHIARQALGFYRESSAPTVVSLAVVLDSALDLLSNKIRNKRITIKTQCDDNIQVRAVPGELRQVLSNLLSNSLDALDEHGIILLRVSSAGILPNHRPGIRITVADNGKGIEPAALPRIFEAFFTTKEEVGTGLGLWVSKELIEKHGGSIRARSATKGPRRGTVFSIILPAEEM